MKWSSVFLLPLVFMSSACERHSASSLPAHGAHAADHAPAAAAPTSAPQAQPATPAKESPGTAPKFFDQQSK